MSTAKLNVWITERGQASRISDTNDSLVHVLHTDGKILTWGGREFRDLQTVSGHVEVDVPPGEYLVCATEGHNDREAAGESLGNHLSHVSVVRVNCGDHAGVYLFDPTFMFCTLWWEEAVAQHVRAGLLEAELARDAAAAVDRLHESLRDDSLTRTMAEHLRRAV